MQTTLLGLAIAFIVALLSALIGPYFVDWSRFRPQFEAEASRVLGTQVRVSGPLDARLLPTPSLQLQSVVVGGPNDRGKVRADRLAVAFSLGALMRGEWRATELTVNGLSLDLGLGQRGRLDWPASFGVPALRSLAIDRLNVTGRVALHDAASRTTLELSDIAFSGDVRALAGSVRGDGNFTWAGARYPFRISTSQGADADGTRLHLAVDRGEKGSAIDVDGVLTLRDRMPGFDGTLALGSHLAATDGKADAALPWRIVSKLKLSPTGAQFDHLEVSFGADAVALRLTGSASARFGAAPRLRGALLARQLDADRMLAKQPDAAGSMQWPTRLAGLLATIPNPPLPTELDITAEQVMLGGRPLQDIDGALRFADGTWAVARARFRAPGSTTVSLQGVARSDSSSGVRTSLDLRSADPDLLAAWIAGGAERADRLRKPLRVRGRFDIAADRIIAEDMKADIDGGSLRGRVALFARGLSGDSEFDGDLTADRLDLDAVASFLRAITPARAGWPDRAHLALTVADAVSSGRHLRPLVAKLGYDPKLVTLTELRIGSPGGTTVEGTGAFDRLTTTGKLTLTAAGAAGQLTDLLRPLAPDLVGRITSPAGFEKDAASLKLALDVGPGKAPHQARVRGALDLAMPQISGTITVAATSPAQAVRGADLAALTPSELKAHASLASPRGEALLDALDMPRIVAVSGPAKLDATIEGAWDAPMRVHATLSGADVDGELKGSVTLAQAKRAADVDLKVKRADLAPLFRIASPGAAAKDASLSSHVVLAGDTLRFSDVDARLLGTRLRGRLVLGLGDEVAVDGEFGMESLDLPQALGIALGTTGDASAPLGNGWLKGWHGRLGFQALRGVLPGGLELRPLSGVIRNDGQSLRFADMKGRIGNGEVRWGLDARPSDSGLSLNAQVRLDHVDGTALHYKSLALPAQRASMQMTLSGQGRTATGLIGTLGGSGSLTLDRMRIAGLDAGVVDAAIAASDKGEIRNDDQLRALVESKLSASDLTVDAAQIPFNLRDGRLSVSATTLNADGAKVVVSGGYDVSADQVDIRASLTPVTGDKAAGNPSVDIFSVGTPARLQTTIDVAALSSWLAIRAIDRETRRLEALERNRVPPVQAPPSPPQTGTQTAPARSGSPDDSTSNIGKPAAQSGAQPAAPPPTPDGDPRRAAPRRQPQQLRAPQASSMPAGGQHVTPLPPPIEIKPAPGATPKPRAPLAITPPAASARRPGL